MLLIIEVGERPGLHLMVVIDDTEQTIGGGEGVVVSPDAPRFAPPVGIYLPVL